jgi:hypothetical protein
MSTVVVREVQLASSVRDEQVLDGQRVEMLVRDGAVDLGGFDEFGDMME